MVAFEWTVAILQSRNGMESMALVALQLAVIFKTLRSYSLTLMFLLVVALFNSGLLSFLSIQQ
jgi:hypothetical protein